MSDMADTAGQPTEQRVSARRWTRFTCCHAVAVVVLLPIVAYIALGWYYRSRVSRELRRLGAEGKPLTEADLSGPPIPDEENALGLYRQASELIESSGAGPQDALHLYELLDWQNEEELIRTVEYVEEREGALEPLRRAVERPYLRVGPIIKGIVEDRRTNYEAVSPLRYFVPASAIAAAYRGDQQVAAERLLVGFRVVRHVSEDPDSSSPMFGSFMDCFLLDAADYVLERGPVPQPVARKLAEELGRIDYRAWIVRATQADWVLGLAVFERARQGRMEHLFGEKPDFTPAAKVVWRIHAVVPPVICSDELWFLETIDERARLAPLPWREWHDSSRALQRPPEWAMVSDRIELVIDFRDRALRAEINEARRGLLATALGLEVYREANGVYPQRLSELSSLDWPICEDVFSGGPFLYRCHGEGYVLYSVGPDLTDDGGHQPEYVGPHMTNGDIVRVVGGPPPGRTGVPPDG